MAERGEFQSKSIVVSPYHVRIDPPRSPSPAQLPLQPHSVRVVSVDIEAHKIYLHEKEESLDQQSDQEPHRQYWTALHKATEIDIVTKSARSHPRHYKDSRVILVRQSSVRGTSAK